MSPEPAFFATPENFRAWLEAAFDARSEKGSGTYSFEQDEVALTEEQEQALRADPAVWQFFSTQAPSYRKAAMWWVIGAGARRPAHGASPRSSPTPPRAAG